MQDALSAAVAALIGATTEAVGRFSYDASTDSWWWSEQVFDMHGFVAHEVVPTTTLMQAHQHPDDRADSMADVVLTALASGEPFASRHRILDSRQKERVLISAGDAISDPDGTVTGVRGLLVDVTRSFQRDLASSTQAAVAAAGESRAVIDQAKGALMLVYGIDEDAAFALLRWYSQRSNLKLRALAQQLVDAATHDVLVSAATRRGLDEVFVSTATGTGTDHGLASPAGELTTEVHQNGDAVVLLVAGEIDLATAPQFTAALAAVIDQAQTPAPVVIDLTQVRHLGSIGLAVLSQYHSRCLGRATPLRVVVGDDTGTVAPARSAGLSIFDTVERALTT